MVEIRRCGVWNRESMRRDCKILPFVPYTAFSASVLVLVGAGFVCLIIGLFAVLRIALCLPFGAVGCTFVAGL